MPMSDSGTLGLLTSIKAPNPHRGKEHCEDGPSEGAVIAKHFLPVAAVPSRQTTLQLCETNR